MAHRLERAALRAARHAARRGLRALPGAALVLILALPARAQAPDVGFTGIARAGLPDAEAWWAEPGRPGWLESDRLGSAFPSAFAGLVTGGWRLEEPGRAPADLPWPGVRQARTALTWYDSLQVGDGDGAWDGFAGSLARLRAFPTAGSARALSTFALANGSSGLDQYALTVARGDSSGALGIDAMNGTRGAAAGFERTGRHLWGGRALWARRAHHLEVTFAQRGAAAGLSGGEQLDAKGQSGSARWWWRRGDRRAALGVERGLDRHFGFGSSLDWSMRDAQQTRAALTLGQARGRRDLETRLEWSDAEVRRTGAGAASRTARSLWAATRLASPLGSGTLVLGLGGGRHAGAGRTELAPSARFDTRLGAARASVALERVLTPVWSDLAPGVAPFLQRVTAATVRLGLGDSSGWRLRGSARAGRAQDRALASRQPLEEMWLRRGLDRDPGTYDFVLGEGGVEWSRRSVGAGLEGFGLGQRETRLPAGAARPLLLDPRAGFRAWLAAGTRLFRGDLGLTLRAEAEGMGQRQAPGALGGPPRVLPAFATLGASATLTLGDVVMVLRGRDLLDRPRPQSWIDSSTGLPAVAGRREARFDLVWRLFN